MRARALAQEIVTHWLRARALAQEIGLTSEKPMMTQ